MKFSALPACLGWLTSETIAKDEGKTKLNNAQEDLSLIFFFAAVLFSTFSASFLMTGVLTVHLLYAFQASLHQQQDCKFVSGFVTCRDVIFTQN